ncbi:hypothetical protein ARC78_11120 [Stenotrophomonas pictorum JCM 9942]|uniref:Uncharacterized protein n=1 Tax=Stenotrophomonas pictorum JCM 9942 TaxID=1236960 RepID=A0A0R0AGL3_9GAMM|nr:hypothetical protein [Stenotrophomonas pictorum]KRG41490.1 hypothetical protein ARC78_11120 [Stenotrophomonas pictorum JCM 9942]
MKPLSLLLSRLLAMRPFTATAPVPGGYWRTGKLDITGDRDRLPALVDALEQRLAQQRAR